MEKKSETKIMKIRHSVVSAQVNLIAEQVQVEHRPKALKIHLGSLKGSTRQKTLSESIPLDRYVKS